MASISSQQDLEAWKAYKANPNPQTRSALLRRFYGVIRSQVGKWAGPVPASVLESQAKLLALKAFDSYDPSKGAALATHVTNSLLPLSRTVYTYQNAARMPEHITMKVNTYNTAVNDFVALHGREPATDELHDRLGWKPAEITRIRDYNVRDLVESGGDVSGSFYDAQKFDDDDAMVLEGMYMTLSPEDKRIFEHTTGYNGAPILKVPEIGARLGMNTAQVAYRKTLIRKQLTEYMKRPSMVRRYGH